MKKQIEKKMGGKVLASGGFGCVFDPALNCEGSNNREKDKITKLMIEKYAIDEYKEINSIKEKLQNLNNYKDYFLIYDATLCKPKKLLKSDLVDFNKKCKALQKNNITRKNINKNIDKLLALNIPNGGLPVDDFIYFKRSISNLKELNNKLIELLLNGIIPMNKKHIYHSDIKDSNVVVKEDKSKLFARLIDWGLTIEYEPFKNKEFPSKWRNRPLQFNVPFSVIIFSDSFIEKYTKYIKEGGKINRENLKPFVIDFIHSWLKERGPGHYKFINDIMFMLFSNDFKNMDTNIKGEFIESNYTIPYITNYIVAILEKFTKFRNDGRINLRDYLDNVYIDIVDVYGFICIYYPLIEVLYENYDKLNKNQLEMFNLIKYVFIKYLYSERTTPINIDDLIKNLQQLGNLINSEKNINANGIKRVKKNKTLKINFKRNRKYMSRRLKKYLMLS